MSAAQDRLPQGIPTDVALRSADPDRAFERLYRRHSSDVYRYALGVVRDAGDAEDVTQTTFLNAFRAIQRGERPIKAKSWLIAIAHNVCLQRFRNASRRPQQVVFDEELAEAAVPEESPSIDDLLRALHQLSFNQRSALVMRELEGRSYKEIGEILGLPVSAVETLLFRARRALREQLETSITCAEAEELLSRQLDGRLPRGERGALRAHLRACGECARLARSQRAQRSAWKALALVPVPTSLSSLFGGGGGAVATSLAAKAAAVGVAALIVGGGTYEGVRVVEAKVATQQKPAAVSAPRAATTERRSAPQHVRLAPAVALAAQVSRQRARRPAHLSKAEAKGRGRGRMKAPASALATPRVVPAASARAAGAPGQAKKATATTVPGASHAASPSKGAVGGTKAKKAAPAHARRGLGKAPKPTVGKTAKGGRGGRLSARSASSHTSPARAARAGTANGSSPNAGKKR